MKQDFTKKINSAVLSILIFNTLGGMAFIISGIVFKINSLLIGGVFVIIAGIAFKLVINHFISKIKENSKE